MIFCQLFLIFFFCFVLDFRTCFRALFYLQWRKYIFSLSKIYEVMSKQNKNWSKKNSQLKGKKFVPRYFAKKSSWLAKTLTLNDYQHFTFLNIKLKMQISLIKDAHCFGDIKVSNWKKTEHFFFHKMLVLNFITHWNENTVTELNTFLM